MVGFRHRGDDPRKDSLSRRNHASRENVLEYSDLKTTRVYLLITGWVGSGDLYTVEKRQLGVENLTGLVGSDHEVFENSRVGSAQTSTAKINRGGGRFTLTRRDPIRPDPRRST